MRGVLRGRGQGPRSRNPCRTSFQRSAERPHRGCRTARRAAKDRMMAAESVTIHACPSVADPPRVLRRSGRTQTTGHSARPRRARDRQHSAVLAHRTGRSFVTAARQPGADVRSLADTLISRAAANGGHLTSTEVARTVESADVTPAQAKKLLRSLAESGVTVMVDDSA